MMRPFLIALQFLTRLPVRVDGEPRDQDLGCSVLYYPLIGLLLGLLLAASSWVFQDIPVLLRAVLLLVVWVIITGALHLDGLADSVDAWVGGLGDRDRTLAIMKDPASGPMGVASVVLVLLVKVAALHALIETNDWMALVLAPLLGRTVLPLLFLTTPYVRPGGLGEALAEYLPRRATAGIVTLIAITVVLVGGGEGFWLLIVTGVAFLLLRAAMRQRLGGTTGDTAGALVEVTETVALLISALMQ